MVDLHLHSTCSDGTLSPQALVEQAVRQGLSAVALTDHDTVSGIHEFCAAGQKAALTAIPGVEISVQWRTGTMHMLGYFINPDNHELAAALEWMRSGRSQRNQEICRRLQQLGYPVRWEDVEALAQGEAVGRPHIARLLMERGIVSDVHEAFQRLLGEGKPAYVDRCRLPPQRAIEVIRRAGGVAVLAHPVTLQLDRPALENCIVELMSYGLAGIECYYPEHAPELTAQLLDICRRHGLVATGGTDYHGETSPDIQMGTGFGDLQVSDEVVEQLLARVPA